MSCYLLAITGVLWKLLMLPQCFGKCGMTYTLKSNTFLEVMLIIKTEMSLNSCIHFSELGDSLLCLILPQIVMVPNDKKQTSTTQPVIFWVFETDLFPSYFKIIKKNVFDTWNWNLYYFFLSAFSNITCICIEDLVCGSAKRVHSRNARTLLQQMAKNRPQR